MSRQTKLTVRVANIVAINSLIKRFDFVTQDGGLLPPFSGGSHVVVEMGPPDQMPIYMNPYSLMSSPLQQAVYSISVRRDDAGRGGSVFMHEHVQVGDLLTLSMPANLFPLRLQARKHLLLAGGIGITPFIAQMAQLAGMRSVHGHIGNFELHFAAQTSALAAYAEQLQQQYSSRVHMYYDDQGQKIPIRALLRTQPLGTHLYVCGPAGMIQWVRENAEQQAWPETSVHFEHFSAPASGQPFHATLADSGKHIAVGTHQSLLEAIEAAGVQAPYLCRGGVCGQCETEVLECVGALQHNDHWLSDEDKQQGQKIMPCVSRFVGEKLVLKR